MGKEEDKSQVTATATATTTADDLVESEELIALIKAIKFAHEDYGCKRVHDQIKTHGGKFARVPFKRVKKYMQKLGMTNNAQDPSSAAAPVELDPESDAGKLRAQAQNSGRQGTIELMTVGGQTRSQRPTADTAKTNPDSSETWLPVKLDEPGAKVGSFPYQAVIRMTKSDEGDAMGAMGEIYKIQVAMEPDGSLSDVHPMLVYNKTRSRKTFLHPDSPAYLPVQKLVKAQGLTGVAGGSKAFFWGRYRKRDDMLYINTDSLAPQQQW